MMRARPRRDAPCRDIRYRLLTVELHSLTYGSLRSLLEGRTWPVAVGRLIRPMEIVMFRERVPDFIWI
jgi:hypothetical protein